MKKKKKKKTKTKEEARKIQKQKKKKEKRVVVTGTVSFDLSTFMRQANLSAIWRRLRLLLAASTPKSIEFFRFAGLLAYLVAV